MYLRYCVVDYGLEQSQELLKTGWQKAFMQVIRRSCRREVLNIWIDLSALMIPG